MKLTPSNPVTILSTRVDRRYIPHVAVFPDGLIRLNIGIGPDNNFTPGYSYHSYDAGRTWQEAPTPCPRVEWNQVFSDGSYYEIDSYFFQDCDAPGTFYAFAGTSADGRIFERETVQLQSSLCEPSSLRSLREMGQPQNPWFDMINFTNHGRDVSLDNVMLGCIHMTSIIELESPSHLLGVAYLHRKGETTRIAVLYESTDRGRHWLERSIIMEAPDTPEGADESALVQLDSGDLYVISRTGALMLQTRSSDMGETWSPPEPIHLTDTGEYVTGVWPIIRKARNGGLLCSYGRPKSTFTSIEQARGFDYVAEHYGHCGKFVMVDPSGTGREWQGRIDLHDVDTACQAAMGVPEEKRLRVQEDTNVRESNSWEYLSLNETDDDVFLVTYDVQEFYENWNSHPVRGVRMVRIQVER